MLIKCSRSIEHSRFSSGAKPHETPYLKQFDTFVILIYISNIAKHSLFLVCIILHFQVDGGKSQVIF